MGLGNDLISSEERRLLDKVIRSKRLFRFAGGKNSYSHAFETKASRLYKGYQCLLFPSASTALWAFIKSLNLPSGSEIIISPLGWVANYSVLTIEKIKISFCPLDEDLNMRSQEVEKLITSKTKAILVAHLMGRQQRYIAEIAELARKRKLYLIEDIAQSFVVGAKKQLAGTFGDFAYSSFNHHKIISTGDGGLVITRHKDIFKRLQMMHDQGCIIKDGRRYIPAGPTPGLSLRVNELTGAVALAQLNKISEIKRLIKLAYKTVQTLMQNYPNYEELCPTAGDIPFLYLFRNNGDKKLNLPSLLESGWHFAGNIPYLKKEFARQGKNSKILKQTNAVLGSIHVIGAGLIDKYYAATIGLPINFQQKDIKLLKQELKKKL